MILLDTHVLLWMDQDSNRLGAGMRRTLRTELGRGAVAVSAISFWEVAMLLAKGRIVTSLDLADWRQDLLRGGLRELVIDGAIGLDACRFHGLHGDPADRLIVATAFRHHATLATADERLLGWSSTLERLDARL